MGKKEWRLVSRASQPLDIPFKINLSFFKVMLHGQTNNAGI